MISFIHFWPLHFLGYWRYSQQYTILRISLLELSYVVSFYRVIYICSFNWTLMYSSVWKLSLQNHSCYIPLESSQHQEAKNHHISLRCVKWRDAMDPNKNWHSSPCLSYNFCANEDKSKILSSWCLVLLSLVILDTINCQKGCFHQCCNAHIFCAFLKKIVYSKICVVALIVPLPV